MKQMGFFVWCCLLLACGGKEEKSADAGSDKPEALFSKSFKAVSMPYVLADSSLLNNKDTASLPLQTVTPLIPDSITRKIFGKTTGIKYTPLAKLEEESKENFYVLKASSGNKKAALLVVFDKDGNYGASMPFLVPDDNAATSQSSSIDKSYTVTKATILREEGAVAGEGREVLAFDGNEKKFTLIMTDLLNDHPAVLVNPIDTFPKTNKFAGDYRVNKKNLIAVRDGRYANQILVYIHTENSDGTCRGELKGEFVMTGSNTAVYRLGGDPCILALTFSGNTVAINEESGCGNHRGLDCPFDGKFTRKKGEKPKASIKKLP